MFCRCFDEDLLKRAKWETGYDDENYTIGYLEGIIMKMVEVIAQRLNPLWISGDWLSIKTKV